MEINVRYKSHDTQINVELTRRYQLLDSLANYLRESTFYTLLSTLPLADPTSPTPTTTYDAQVAIHDGLDILNEVIFLTETLEEDAYKREVEKRRMRLGASGPDQLKKEVFTDISNSSQVKSILFSTDHDDKRPISSLIFIRLS